MKLHTLKPASGATQTRKRIGRGPGSGLGGTSTRGHKGAKARSGYSKKIGFEGGQMPLQRRLPKFGFKNINRVEYKAINLSALQELAERVNLKVIGRTELIEAGFLNPSAKVKILASGTLSTALTIQADAFSKGAEAAILAAGGQVEKPVETERFSMVGLNALQALATEKKLDKVGAAELVAAGLIAEGATYKVYAVGKLNSALTIEAHSFSTRAAIAIKAAKGKIVNL